MSNGEVGSLCAVSLLLRRLPQHLRAVRYTALPHRLLYYTYGYTT